MQVCLFDLLLNAYLNERSKSIDLSRLSLPNITQSQNALLSLEKLYLNTNEQSLSNNKTNDQNEKPKKDDEHNEISIDKDTSESSQITITVCDESKNSKRQFLCNRSLLIREMRYFADYLKDEPDQAEEVDISVHCDIDIFQWLMSFVNRIKSTDIPELEPRIAVSILISSDFLKMDKLVRQSLEYIYKNLNEIIATNCNVSCIPDLLFRQLAKYFYNPYKIEQLHDRKNKIRGKLFEYSLKQLLTDRKIIRCQYCHTIMSIEQIEFIPCLSERLMIKTNGNFSFQHKIDSKFNINDWIKEIHMRGENSWRNTFWIIWLHIHGDQCARCDAYFRFIDFSTCSYHPLSSITDKKHDCCSQLIGTFDIFQLSTRHNGCQQREHICQTQNDFSEIYENLDKTELIKHHPSLQISLNNINSTNVMTSKIMEQSIYGSANPEAKKASLRSQWTPFLDSHPYGGDIKNAWDATKSTRWNQDAQREDEHRRFDEMLRHIQSTQQINKTNHNRSLKETSSSSSLLSPGGIYCRIENDWRTRQNIPINTNKNRQRTTLK
ncbi:unnamed protein product [Adineta steineri]|uniref:SANT and BTB domain-containing protein n=1 Tax=Adineta steineri TaxID=433720 RepID=A0A818LNH3_9BILA|nr:unnamed protein product [Adineta steineri]CAF3578860.1 unnamed protein product [Adineta steineri]